MKRLQFSYTPVLMARPLWSLQGRRDRPRPLLLVSVIGPTGTDVDEALLDTGSDDTVFPETVAHAIGIDLSHAPIGVLSGVGSAAGIVRYAEVVLRLTDGREYCQWPARVGFTATPLKRPLLGFAGFLQYFQALFDGEREQVELTTTGSYPGT